ncbi:unnamed protein product, partial [Hymenolepis diminuta]
VLFYISSFGFYHSLISSPKSTDCNLSSEVVVLIDVLHCADYCFYERGGFGVMGMLINFLFNHAPYHSLPSHLTPHVIIQRIKIGWMVRRLPQVRRGVT